jgi:hypothetical protein
MEQLAARPLLIIRRHPTRAKLALCVSGNIALKRPQMRLPFCYPNNHTTAFRGIVNAALTEGMC